MTPRCMFALVALTIAVRAASAQHAPQTSAPTPIPAPSGAHVVGASIAYLVDSARRDADFPDGRPVTVQLWYPAAGARGALAPYLMERGLAAALAGGYYGVDTTTLASWETARTHAYLDAPPAAGRFPLVTLSTGMGVVRANYTALVEELASRGWIVAMVESPLLGTMVTQQGRVVTDTVGRFQSAAAHRAGVTAWARDVTFALDRLAAQRVGGSAAAVSTTIDWRRIAAAGHSSGGLAALESCARDTRVRACVNMDGGIAAPDGEPMAEAVRGGLAKPTLLLRSQPLYDDADFARRGITRAEWEKRGAAGRVAEDSLVARSPAVVVARVAGTGHMSFSDAPFVMPTTITRFGGRSIAPARGLEVITATVRAFLEQSLEKKTGALAAVAARAPELSLRAK